MQAVELLNQLENGAKGRENLMPIIVQCVEADLTLGEICDVLRKVWGEYQPPAGYRKNTMAKVKKINHVAIVVSDLDGSLQFWRDALGLPLDHIEDVPSQKAQVAFFTSCRWRKWNWLNLWMRLLVLPNSWLIEDLECIIYALRLTILKLCLSN